MSCKRLVLYTIDLHESHLVARQTGLHESWLVYGRSTRVMVNLPLHTVDPIALSSNHNITVEITTNAFSLKHTHTHLIKTFKLIA